jgi:pyruvate/2-oxoglutarate dehydrogenase complex dihydrolipoamide acyltransferase (E2) component
MTFRYSPGAAGTLSAVFVKEGETVPIDMVLATLETP